MHNFKVGDKVRRISGGWAHKPGDVDVVVGLREHGGTEYLMFADRSAPADAYELVEPEVTKTGRFVCTHGDGGGVTAYMTKYPSVDALAVYDIMSDGTLQLVEEPTVVYQDFVIRTAYGEITMSAWPSGADTLIATITVMSDDTVIVEKAGE